MGNGHSTAACLPWPQEVLHMLTDTEMLTTLRQHPLLAGLAEGTFQEVCRLAIQAAWKRASACCTRASRPTASTC